MGLRDGWNRFEIANLPDMLVFFHSCCQIFVVAVFDLRLALDLEVLNGIWQPSEVVASLASWSARSFPGMSQ